MNDAVGVLKRRWRPLLLLVAFALAVGGYEARRALRRPIPFDAARWREPRWSWDRWRMVADLQREFAERGPARGDVLRMLGRPRDEAARESDSLVYPLGRPPPGGSGSGEIVIYFDERGRYSGSQVSADAF